MFLAGYILLCLTGILFTLTGYSFTLDVLDYVLWGIILLFPIVQFFRSGIPGWIKLITVLLVFIAAIFLGEGILVAIAFGREESHTVQKWKLNGYSVTLSKRQGWAGPFYYRYDLAKNRLFGLINKTVAESYPGMELPGSCKIEFQKDIYNDKILFEFDHCQQRITKVQ